METSPYNADHPIRVIHSVNYVPRPAMSTCGQTCLAMLADVSVDEICKVMGNSSTTTYEDIVCALDYYGFRHKPPQPYQGTLPRICLPRIQFPEYGHSVLYFDEKFYDPEFGVLDACHTNGKIMEFIEIYQ